MEKEKRFAKSERKIGNLALATLYINLVEGRYESVDDIADYKTRGEIIKAHRREARRIANYPQDISTAYFSNNHSFEGRIMEEFYPQTLELMGLMLSGQLDSAKKRMAQWNAGLIGKLHLRGKFDFEMAFSGCLDNAVSCCEQDYI